MKLALLRTLAPLAKPLRQLGLGQLVDSSKTLLRGPITVERDGLRFQGSIENHRIIQHLAAGTFEPYTLILVRQALHPGMTVIDVGANIGIYTLTASKAVGPSGRVYACEPDPRTLKDLHANLAANALGNVTVIPAAITATKGTHGFYLRGAAGHSGLYAAGETYDERIEVPTMTIDDIAADAPVDLIKVDAQGADLDVFTGASHTLHANPQLRVIVEYAPPELAAAQRSGDELVAFLTDHFAHVFRVDEQDQQLVPIDGGAVDLRPGQAFTNLYCLPAGSDP